MVASCTPWDRSGTSSLEGKRARARRRRRSSSAWSAMSTRKGRIVGSWAVAAGSVGLGPVVVRSDIAVPFIGLGTTDGRPSVVRNLGGTCGVDTVPVAARSGSRGGGLASAGGQRDWPVAARRRSTRPCGGSARQRAPSRRRWTGTGPRWPGCGLVGGLLGASGAGGGTADGSGAPPPPLSLVQTLRWRAQALDDTARQVPAAAAVLSRRVDGRGVATMGEPEGEAG